jgi:hypothetical protein
MNPPVEQTAAQAIPPPPPRPTSEPTKRKSPWRWILGVVALLVVASTVADLNELSRERQQPSDAEVAIGATQHVSDADAEVLAHLSAQVKAYNAAVLPVFNDYLDPTISGADWVEGAQPHLVQMRTAIAEMQKYVALFEDVGLRTAFQKVPQLLEDQYLALDALQVAVTRFDLAAEKNALKELRVATRARRQYGLELLTTLREVLPDDVLQEWLESQK